MLHCARIDGVEILALGLARHLEAQEEIGIARDQRLRQRRGLREKRPVIDLQRVKPVHAIPIVIGRQDIEHGEPRQPPGMIEREAIGHPAAAIVPGEREMYVAELLHRFHHRLRHRALGVGRMIRVALRHVGPAIARQIGDDQREGVREFGRDAMPLHMGLRKTVQQQQRRPLAADAGEDASRTGVDPFGGKAGIEVGKIGHFTLSSSGVTAKHASNFVCRCRRRFADICHPASPTNNKPKPRKPPMSIDFEVPAEAKAIREKVRKWVHEECIPAEKELDTKPLDEVLGPLRAKARAQGLWCPFVPKQYGGMGLGPLANALVQMELGESMLGALSMNTQGPDDASMLTILEHGTEYQKEKFLKPLLNGDKRICFSMTEKAAGADATGMQTSAVKDGNENYILNGEKWFSSSASVADMALVMAKTDPDAPRHKQYSTFIVELPNPGYNIKRNIKNMAIEGPHDDVIHGGHSEIEIKDLKV